MTYVRSFTHIERELMHHYRDQLNHAESVEDIKKFFSQTISQLLNRIMDGEPQVREGDAVLNPESPPYYDICRALAECDAFRATNRSSDLHAVLRRFAEPAAKHHQHLLGNREKTEAKIRHRS